MVAAGYVARIDARFRRAHAVIHLDPAVRQQIDTGLFEAHRVRSPSGGDEHLLSLDRLALSGGNHVEGDAMGGPPNCRGRHPLRRTIPSSRK
jgi:hypothetical protein